jgi:hypothetical protein
MENENGNDKIFENESEYLRHYNEKHKPENT